MHVKISVFFDQNACKKSRNIIEGTTEGLDFAIGRGAIARSSPL